MDKKKSKLVNIVLIVLAIILLLAIVYLAAGEKKTEPGRDFRCEQRNAPSIYT